jgi:hypothetical protein
MALPLALIGMIPSIINLFTGETSRTDSVIDLAKKAGEALGMENASPEDVLKHIEQNPDAVVKLKELEFNAKALENEHLRKQVEEADRHEEAKRNMAHETYRIKSDKQDRIAEQIISFNLPVIAVLVLVNIGLVYYMKENASLIAIASNIIGVAIGNLFNERQSIINFFFGSSMGSKEKQDKLDTMLKGK